MASKQQTSQQSSHGKLIAVVAVAALVIILALVSAFVWPGWAIRGNQTATKEQSQSQSEPKEPTTPSLTPVALPQDATELLSAMPDSVLNYARISAGTSDEWKSSSPIEEYEVKYAAKQDGDEIVLHVAQWSTADEANKQYGALVAAISGKQIAKGKVNVKQDSTSTAVGNYTVNLDADNEDNATATWQNDTAVFQARGTTRDIKRFYQNFPM